MNDTVTGKSHRVAIQAGFLMLVLMLALMLGGCTSATDNSTAGNGAPESEMTQTIVTSEDFNWPFGGGETWFSTTAGSNEYLFEDNNLLIIDLIDYRDGEHSSAIFVRFGNYDLGLDTLSGSNVTTIYTSNVNFTDEGFSLDYDGVQIQATFEKDAEEDAVYLVGTLTVAGSTPYDFSIKNSSPNQTEGCKTCMYTGFVEGELCEACTGRGHFSVYSRLDDKYSL